MADAAADAASSRGWPLILAGGGRVESRSECSNEMGVIIIKRTDAEENQRTLAIPAAGPLK